MSSFFQCQVNQTGGKSQNSSLVTVKSSFQVTSTGRKLFSASTTDRENYLSQSPVVNFGVFYWLDLVWHCTNKVRCVLKRTLLSKTYVYEYIKGVFL